MKAREVPFQGTCSQGGRCFIIAEAGVNHNGDLGRALALVDAAADAGASAVKFQTWITEKVVDRSVEQALYQEQNTGRKQSQFELLKDLELPFSAFISIKERCMQRGIQFLSTPDDEESADFLEKLGVSIFKIGSAEVTNLQFLRHVARKNRPIILSTGMSTIGEVETAVRAIEEAGNVQITLLHCVSSYPASPSDCNLRVMETLRVAFGYPVGFSDHTVGIDIAVAAVALGARVIEKHFTLDRSLPGPDHLSSLSVDELTALVASIKRVESALGSGRKVPMDSEVVTARVVRRRTVAARDLQPGDRLGHHDIALRRASEGFSASRIDDIVGMTLSRAKKMGDPIVSGDFA